MNKKRTFGVAAVVVVIGLLSYKLLLNKHAVEAKMYRHDASQNILVSVLSWTWTSRPITG